METRNSRPTLGGSVLDNSKLLPRSTKNNAVECRTVVGDGITHY